MRSSSDRRAALLAAATAVPWSGRRHSAVPASAPTKRLPCHSGNACRCRTPCRSARSRSAPRRSAARRSWARARRRRTRQLAAAGWLTVVAAVADDGPAVVAPRSSAMLISSPPCGPCSLRPQLAGCRMQRRALRVAVAVAPDLRAARRHAERTGCRPARAVAVDAHHLAEVAVQILRVGFLACRVAQRHEQRLVVGEDEPRAEVAVAASTLGNCRKIYVALVSALGSPRRAGRASRRCPSHRRRAAE